MTSFYKSQPLMRCGILFFYQNPRASHRREKPRRGNASRPPLLKTCETAEFPGLSIQFSAPPQASCQQLPCILFPRRENILSDQNENQFYNRPQSIFSRRRASSPEKRSPARYLLQRSPDLKTTKPRFY